MQNQQLPPRLPHKKPSKAAMWLFGWMALVSYVLAIVVVALWPFPPASEVSLPTASEMASVFLSFVALLSTILWAVALSRYRQAMQPLPPPVPWKNRITTEDIYLETAQLRQEAQHVASQAALHGVPYTPDEVNGLMILGVAIDSERYERESPLLKRVITRDKLHYILTGRKF